MTTPSHSRPGAQAKTRDGAIDCDADYLTFLAQLTLATISVAAARPLGLSSGRYPTVLLRRRDFGPKTVKIGDLIIATDAPPKHTSCPVATAATLLKQLRRLWLASRFDGYRGPVLVASPDFSDRQIVLALREVADCTYTASDAIKAVLPPGAADLLCLTPIPAKASSQRRAP